MAENSTHVIRCGDHVYHRLSHETWLVAYADYERNDLAWSGWPEGVARLSDCRLIYAATDAEHAEHVAQWLSKDGNHDHRQVAVRRLYGVAHNEFPKVAA